MVHIDYYLSATSPWCYLAGDRLERIATRHGAGIRYRPLDLLQLLDRTGGTRPDSRHPSRSAYREQDLLRCAAEIGLPLQLHPVAGPVSAAPASYAIIAAQNAAKGDTGALVRAVLHAYWAEGRDIANDAVLRDILAGCGFDPGLVDSGLFIGAENYGRNLEDAVAAGVFGVPFYLLRDSGQMFWGQDRLDALDRHLAAGTGAAG